jgi:sec-independent protein translocase protein TatA
MRGSGGDRPGDPRRRASVTGVGIENPVHLLFLGAVALLVLGPKKLPELARALGKGMREFRDAISGESHGETVHTPPEQAAPPVPGGPPSEA